MKQRKVCCANARRRFAAALASVLCLPRWTFGMGLAPKPPLSIPFAAHRKGEVIETELRILEHRNYEFDLVFRFRHLDEDDRRRVEKLLGDDYKNIYGQYQLQNQVVLSLRIWAANPAGNQSVFDRILENYESGGGTGGFFTTRRLEKVRLRPGLYRLRVESLQDVPALATVPIEFHVGWSYNTQPLDD